MMQVKRIDIKIKDFFEENTNVTSHYILSTCYQDFKQTTNPSLP